MSTKQLEVQIMQQTYLLACPEGQEPRLLDAVERVDTAMTRIRDAGKVRARERIAVLAALNLAFELADQQERLAEAGPRPAAPQGETQPADARQLLLSLVQRLDDALGSDGQLI
ncbi:cell division protein ZapA [Comamonas flocculans]|uniref:Cell division protein ZapA n=1 Tax=Comamonas flocculans TaxID=2597701 RepID=A0A5B8RZG9_9BURK|nr:cell division protein ZapA [Comamonas flocculans]QEA13605.1 cell division protein ZapA [Comamonas flocculans]